MYYSRVLFSVILILCLVSSAYALTSENEVDQTYPQHHDASEVALPGGGMLGEVLSTDGTKLNIFNSVYADGSGKVGIGTSSPQSVLDVVGGVTVRNGFSLSENANYNNGFAPNPHRFDSLQFTSNFLSNNPRHAYVYIWQDTYSMQPGDKLEFDVYCNMQVSAICDPGIELVGKTPANGNWNGRWALVDQDGITSNGVNSGSGNAIISAHDQWHHRVVDLTPKYYGVGTLITGAIVSTEYDTSGYREYYYRQIMITNNGQVQKILYNGGKPQVNTNYTVSNAQNVKVIGGFFSDIHIDGDLNVDGDVIVEGDICTGDGSCVDVNDLTQIIGTSESPWDNNTHVVLKGDNINKNVGIGTDNPTSKLEVEGNTELNGVVTIRGNYVETNSGVNELHRMELGQSTGNNYAYLDLKGDATYNDYGLRLLRGNTGANSMSQLLHRGTGQLRIGAFDGGSVQLLTQNTPRLSIESDGDVGIGTSAPLAKLNVFGSTILGSAPTGTMQSTGTGSLALGATVPGGSILSSGFGSVAGGYATGSGSIQATHDGARANGYSTLGSIRAINNGATAEGFTNGASIIAQGAGSYARGYAWDSNDIITSGSGSIAIGTSFYNKLESSGSSSIAIGNGVRASQTDSIAIGKGVHANAVGTIAIGEDFTSDYEHSFSVGYDDIVLKVDGAKVEIGEDGINNFPLYVAGNTYADSFCFNDGSGCITDTSGSGGGSGTVVYGGFWESNAANKINLLNPYTKVGIGTTNPSTQLQIHGDDAYKLMLTRTNNKGMAFSIGNVHPFVQFTDGLSFIGKQYSDLGTWGAGDSATLYLDGNNQRVGINRDSADTALHIEGATRSTETYAVELSPFADGSKINFGTIADPDNFMNMGAYGNQNNINTFSRPFEIRSSATDNILYLNNVNGNVGIGSATPSYKLDVNGNARIGSSLYLTDTNTMLNQGGGGSLQVTTAFGNVRIGPQSGLFMDFRTDSPMYRFDKQIAVDAGLITSKDSPFILKAEEESNLNQNQIHLATNGNIGFGTVPSVQFHFKAPGNVATLRLTTDGIDKQESALMQIQNRAIFGYDAGNPAVDGDESVLISDGNAFKPIVFKTTPNGQPAAIERVRINNQGQVGIGVVPDDSNPNSLTVAGGILADSICTQDACLEPDVNIWNEVIANEEATTSYRVGINTEPFSDTDFSLVGSMKIEATSGTTTEKYFEKYHNVNWFGVVESPRCSSGYDTSDATSDITNGQIYTGVLATGDECYDREGNSCGPLGIFECRDNFIIKSRPVSSELVPFEVTNEGVVSTKEADYFMFPHDSAPPASTVISCTNANHDGAGAAYFDTDNNELCVCSQKGSNWNWYESDSTTTCT